MDQNGHKLVKFWVYCKKCKHKGKNDNEQPCAECLEEPTNLYSDKPVKWEEK